MPRDDDHVTHLRLLSDAGPVSAIRVVHPTAEQRTDALSNLEARHLVRQLRRDSNHTALVGLYVLAIGVEPYMPSRMRKSDLFDPIDSALESGTLLFTRGWSFGKSRLRAEETARTQSIAVGVAGAIMGDREALAFEGQRYRLTTTLLFSRLRVRDRYRAVSLTEVPTLLKRMADSIPATEQERAQWAEAVALASDQEQRERLLLVRDVEPLPASAPSRSTPPSSQPAPAAGPSKPPPAKEPPPAKARKVLSIAWTQAEAWCSENAGYCGTTDGYAPGDALDVSLQERGGAAHKTSLKLSSPAFSGQWQVKDVVPPKAGGHCVRELKIDAEAGGQKSPTALVLKFAPTAKKISHTHGRHAFQLSVLDYVVEIDSDIKFVPGWGASVVKLGSKVPPATGGLLDGQFAWSGYRWMKRVGVTNKFWDGTSWQDLPKGFTLIDANNFCVGFSQSGTAFVCQYGGTWPEKFTPWNVRAPDKAKTIKAWTDNIRTTWTGKLDLKRADCKSSKKECCRYRVKVAASFSQQSALSAGVIIIADGDIRSNDALFFLGESRVAMAAHEFGHHIGNPDEYRGAKVDTTLNTDGAKNGIDDDSIMGQNLTKVKARHFRLLATVLAEAIQGEYGKALTFNAVPA